MGNTVEIDIKANTSQARQALAGFKSSINDSLKIPEGQIENARDSMARWITTLKNAGAENITYAKRIATITQAYKDGAISSDQAREQLERVRKEVEKADEPIRETTRSLADFAKGAMDIKAGFDILKASIVGVVDTAMDIGKAGAQFNQTTESFDGLISKLGVAPGLLKRLQAASRGTIDDMKLMASTTVLLAGASDTLALNLANATPELLEIAKAANKLNPSLGDTAFLYESITTGIKRGSPMILDNLGITIKIGEANEKYAESLGKTVEQLTGEEAKVALLNATLEAGNVLMEQAGGNADSAVDSFARLEVTTKNLTDEVKGRFAPGLADAADATLLLLTYQKQLDEVLKEANETNIKGAKSYGEYVEGAKYQAKAAGLVTKEINGQLVVFRQLPHGVMQVADNLRIMSEAEWGASRGAAEADKRLGQWGNTIRTTANVDIPNVNNAMDAMAGRYQAQANMIIEANQKAADSIKNDISAAMDVAREAADKWIEGAGGDVASELENADLSAGELNQAYIALDGAMGTNTYNAKLQADATKKIVEEYEKTGDVDAFKNSLLRLKNGGFIPLLDDVKIARLEIQGLIGDLRLVDGTFTAHVVVDIPTTRSTPDPRGGGHATDPDDDNFATGGSYTVPGGYHENYPVGIGKYASSGETVTITPAGQTTNMGGIIININGARSPGATADAVALRLAKYGKQYQGQ